MAECYVCLSAGGVRACRCASHVHITCLAPLILSAGFKCKACGGGFNKAVVAALTLIIFKGSTCAGLSFVTDSEKLDQTS